MISRLKRIMKIDPIKFVRWNLLSRNIIRDKGQYIIPKWHAVIDIQKTAVVELHATLYVNDPKYSHSKEEAFLILGDKARLKVNGIVRLGSGAIIQVHNNASLQIGACFINHDATLIVANNMTLGDGNLIARGVKILDSDHHKILDKAGHQINKSKPVKIGNHVWIGMDSIILKGSNIEDGVVIAAGSLVKGEISAETIAKGCPAKSVSSVQWEE